MFGKAGRLQPVAQMPQPREVIAVERGLAAFAPTGGARLRAFDAFKALTLDLAASIFVRLRLITG